MSYRLRPEVRLRARPEFVRVQGAGRRVGNPFMTVLALPNSLTCDRLGVIASRKFGPAVSRNKAKRRMRALFRALQPDTSGARGHVPLDVVVVPRREFTTAPFDQLRTEFTRALARIDRTRRAS